MTKCTCVYVLATNKSAHSKKLCGPTFTANDFYFCAVTYLGLCRSSTPVLQSIIFLHYQLKKWNKSRSVKNLWHCSSTSLKSVLCSAVSHWRVCLYILYCVCCVHMWKVCYMTWCTHNTQSASVGPCWLLSLSNITPFLQFHVEVALIFIMRLHLLIIFVWGKPSCSNWQCAVV